jgi:hypothetical protein
MVSRILFGSGFLWAWTVAGNGNERIAIVKAREREVVFIVRSLGALRSLGFRNG